MPKNTPLIILSVVAVVIVGIIVFLESQKSQTDIGKVNQPIQTAGMSEITQQKSSKYELGKEIVAPAGYINTDEDGITIQELIGKKVILVDFWTYSCINCQRTLPYLTAWYEKYKDQGLEIVGVHTPEFEFEKKQENVQAAVDQWGVEYPVVLDNDYGTWRNYANRYWPRKYLIDIDGYVVYDHIGEGAYAETEKKIQELLSERMVKLDEQGKISSDVVQPENVEVVTSAGRRSPETYFGALRNEYFASGSTGAVGEQNFKTVANPGVNKLYLSGLWNIQNEFAENKQAGGKIIYRFQAEKVFLVARADQNVTLNLLLDGQKVDLAGGSDVIDSKVNIQEDRLYRLIELPDGYGEHILEIIADQPGLQVFAFTFG